MFGYDPIDKQFKVLSMTRLRDRRKRNFQEHQVLTLGTRNRSWRMVECSIPHYHDYSPPEDICINGVLYYKSLNESTETYLVVCFDIRSEKFSFIEVKTTLRTALPYGSLINYDGKLGLIMSEGGSYVNEGSRSVQLWVLEDVGKQEWSDHVYVLPDLWKKIDRRTFLLFAGVTRASEIVLSSGNPYYPYYLVYLSIKRSTVVARVVEIHGMNGSYYGRHRIVLDHVEDVKLFDV